MLVEVPFPTLDAEGQALFEIIRRFPLDIEKGPWVAGGCLMRVFAGIPLGSTDIDIFCATNEQVTQMLNTLAAIIRAKNRIVSDHVYHFQSTRLAETFAWGNRKVQVIHKPVPTLDELLGNFDFSVCCFATDGRLLYASPDAIDDVKNRLIRKRAEAPAKSGSLGRVEKYMGLGFRLTPGLLRWAYASRTCDEHFVCHPDLKDEEYV